MRTQHLHNSTKAVGVEKKDSDNKDGKVRFMLIYLLFIIIYSTLALLKQNEKARQGQTRDGRPIALTPPLLQTPINA